MQVPDDVLLLVYVNLCIMTCASLNIDPYNVNHVSRGSVLFVCMGWCVCITQAQWIWASRLSVSPACLTPARTTAHVPMTLCTTTAAPALMDLRYKYYGKPNGVIFTCLTIYTNPFCNLLFNTSNLSQLHGNYCGTSCFLVKALNVCVYVCT